MYKEEIYNAKTGETTRIPFTDEELEARAAYMRDVYPVKVRETIKEKRAAAYRLEADPLFFKAQRGEATTDEWTAKVAEIKARFPYPGGEE